MNIYTTIILILTVLEYILADQVPQKKYNIRKGRDKTSRVRGALPADEEYPPFQLCDFGDIILEARVVYTSLVSYRNILFRIEARTPEDRVLIQSYEVENCDLTPKDSNTKGQVKSYKEQIKSKGLCNSFQLEQLSVNSERLFLIKFNNQEEWWCDVYSGYTNMLTFNYKDMDKCTELYKDFEALSDPIFNSAELPSNDDVDVGWGPCPGKKAEELCTQDDKLTVTATYVCRKGKMMYQVVTYFNGIQMGTYMISNSKSPDLKVDPVRICRLFRFKIEEKKNDVMLQFLHNGPYFFWRCKRYRLKIDMKVKRYIPGAVNGPCRRFHDYTRPKNPWRY